MTFKNLTVILLSLFMISCGSDGGGPKALSTKAEKRGKKAGLVNGVQASPNTEKPTGSSWGRVYRDDSQVDQAAFQKQVVLLLEPQFKASEVGLVSGVDERTVSADQTQDTGIAFWAQGLSLTGGLDPRRVDYQEAENVFNENSAALRMSIFMAVKTDDENTRSVLEVPIHFNDGETGVDSGQLVDSYIKDNFIQLTFADEFGKVSLAGYFDQNTFKGQVYFKTEKTAQEDNVEAVEVVREAQVLGKFEVSTCGFFTCVN